MKEAKVYIIDDDLVYQYTAIKTLGNIIDNSSIKVFPDGEEAINFISQHIENNEELPDVIFLDLNMPIMDGWEFLNEFKKFKTRYNKLTHIYLVSSSNDDTDTERANKFNLVEGYLVKPVSQQIYLEILDKLRSV